MSNNYWNAEQFYPTPETLLKKITKNINWSKVNSILEPSAGKGDIIDFLVEERAGKYASFANRTVDCIEINPTLRATLQGKEYHVVADDFLKFHTYFHYDLIIMNPPFENGATHLLKALELQEHGGGIICILNAETIRNPYTNERKSLVRKLEDLDADIEYYTEEFSNAENKTMVEVAVITVEIPEKQNDSEIYTRMKQKNIKDKSVETGTELETGDYIQAIIDHYNLEVETGLALISEYKALQPYILNDLKENEYSKPILQMQVLGKSGLSENDYVKKVRSKYWTALFADNRFTGKMTSNLRDEYMSKVHDLKDYDFSLYNIMQIQMDMAKRLSKGIEECIIELFDKLSYTHSYNDEYSKNIHYYNGWKTNKSWIINKKVIIPFYGAFRSWSGKLDVWECAKKLNDIEKALDYLDNKHKLSLDIHSAMIAAERNGITRNIQLKHFTVSIYKKGTCHITFNDDELLKKFNIFGSQRKGWLPYEYGKKAYDAFTDEEKSVIDEFQGKKEYEKVYAHPENWLFDPAEKVLQIEKTA